MATTDGGDTDIFAYYAEPPLVAVNLFHLRNGHIVDRREFFWEDQREFDPPEFFSSLMKQVYLDDPYVPAVMHVPVEFEDREVLEELFSERSGRKVEIHTPQSGQKKAMLELVESNAKHSFEQRFRVLKPSSLAIQAALQDALGLEKAPQRIECFDISHIQGTDKVASMVVWENGRMKKSDYRKFIIKTVEGNDDFASMREVITRPLWTAEGRKFAAARAWFWSMEAWASCTRPRQRWNSWESRISRWRRSRSGTNGFMSTGRKKSRSCWTISRPCCI